jgi:hypothetical protein
MTDPDEPRERPRHYKTAVLDSSSKWTAKQVARLGFLVGLGWSAKRIAEDPLLACNAHNVYRRANRFGLSFLEARAMLASDLPPEAHDRLGAAADKRGLTREALERRLLREIAMDPHLIDNVLDDDFGRETLGMKPARLSA